MFKKDSPFHTETANLSLVLSGINFFELEVDNYSVFELCV